MASAISMTHLLAPKPPPVVIRFAGPERIRSAPIYVAMDKGFLAEQGITLVITPSQTGKDGLSDTLAGRQDVAAVAGMPVVSAWAEGSKPAVLASLSQSNAQVAIVSRRGVAADIRGLRGRTVGIVKTTTSELFLLTMLQTAGLTLQDVETVDFPNAVSLVDALVSGQISAASLWEPSLGQALIRLRPDVSVIGNDGSFVDYWLLVTSEAWLTANCGTAERLLRALIKAQEFIRTHPDQARDIVMSHVSRDSMSWDERIFRVRLDTSLLESLKGNARIGLGVANVAGLEDILHPEVLRAVAPNMVGLEARP